MWAAPFRLIVLALLALSAGPCEPLPVPVTSQETVGHACVLLLLFLWCLLDLATTWPKWRVTSSARGEPAKARRVLVIDPEPPGGVESSRARPAATGRARMT